MDVSVCEPMNQTNPLTDSDSEYETHLGSPRVREEVSHSLSLVGAMAGAAGAAVMTLEERQKVRCGP